MCILPHRWVRKHALCLRFGVRLRFGLRLRCFFVHRCGDRGCDNRGDERCSRREVCEPLVASGQGGPRRVARELRGSPRGTPEGTDGRTPSLASQAGEIAVSSPDPGYTLFQATPPRSPDLRGTDQSTDARAFRPRVLRRTLAHRNPRWLLYWTTGSPIVHPSDPTSVSIRLRESNYRKREVPRPVVPRNGMRPERRLGVPTLEDLIAHERQEPWRRRGGDGTANAPMVIDCE